MKARQVPANWGSSADQWKGGDVSKWGGQSSGGQGGSRQTSQRKARQFGSWPGMPGGGSSRRDTQSGGQGASDSTADGKEIDTASQTRPF